MKVLLVSELLQPPLDEGMKRFAASIRAGLEEAGNVYCVGDRRGMSRVMNRLFLVPRAARAGRKCRVDRIVFIPEASLTFFAFIKAFLLRLLIGKPVVMIGLQRRGYRPWQQKLIRRIAPNRLFALSDAMAAELHSIGLRCEVIPTGVDCGRFRPGRDVALLRTRHHIDPVRQVWLHVGHIREGRNLRWLMQIAWDLPWTQFVVVGSTSTTRDQRLQADLEKAGIRVFADFQPRIEEIYQAANGYIFPVQETDAAIETPLSVLEAMATNLPVLTTRFGRLPELFSEDEGFHFIDSPWDAVCALRARFGIGPCPNREKVLPLDWKRSVERILED